MLLLNLVNNRLWILLSGNHSILTIRVNNYICLVYNLAYKIERMKPTHPQFNLKLFLVVVVVVFFLLLCLIGFFAQRRNRLVLESMVDIFFSLVKLVLTANFMVQFISAYRQLRFIFSPFFITVYIYYDISIEAANRYDMTFTRQFDWILDHFIECYYRHTYIYR